MSTNILFKVPSEWANKALVNTDKYETMYAESINNNLRTQAISTDITIRQLLGSLRMAITAQKVAPPLFETIEILSKSRTIKLIEKAIIFLEKSVNN